MFCHVLTPASPILTKKHTVTNKTGRYKVQTLAQHDSRQAYKLELVSYNIRCPHYKMRFQQVAIFHEKSRETNKMRFQQVAFP